MKRVSRLILWLLLICSYNVFAGEGFASKAMDVIAARTDGVLHYYNALMQYFAPTSGSPKIKEIVELPLLFNYKNYHTDIQTLLDSGQLEFGAHLAYYIRGGGFYNHHGIHIGNGTIVHRTGLGEDDLEAVSYRKFCHSARAAGRGHDAKLMKIVWDQPLDENKIKDNLENWGRENIGSFNVFVNNCEHYVTERILGFPYSAQVTGWGWFTTSWTVLFAPLALIYPKHRVMVALPFLPLAGALYLGVERQMMLFNALTLATLVFLRRLSY